MHCPACEGRELRQIELVSAERIAAVWEAEFPAAGEIIRRYVAEGQMPSDVATLQCEGCRLEFFSPSCAAGPEWYRLVERYPDRWEYGEALADLGGSGFRILEIGCGAGMFLARAVRAGHAPVGIDFNEPAVQIARAQGLDAHTWDLREVRTHVEEHPEAVAFFHVLEHIEDLDGFFIALRAIMPIGSTLHLSCPGPRRYTSALLHHQRIQLRDMWDYPPHHQTRWRRSAIEALLDRHGWRTIRCTEEPLDWRGLATRLTSIHHGDLSAYPATLRRARIAMKMIRTARATRRYTGMSIYAAAVRMR
jgi:2-polyprenyl-3-methyl-5-hydroxy-6-metoxy-1,4-benzoquinol methylase